METVFVPSETGNTFLNITSIKFLTDIITPELHTQHVQAKRNGRTKGTKPVSPKKSTLFRISGNIG